MKNINKHLILGLILGTLVGMHVFAERIDSASFSPMTPEVIGQGGSFSAVSHGYNSLFTNPAGFARPDGDFTLLSITASPTSFPGQGADDSDEHIYLQDMVNMNFLDDFLQDGNIGLENLGIGLVARGIGLGLVSNVDLYERGASSDESSINAIRDQALIVGYAVPLELGPMSLSVGGDLRYMMRTEIPDVFSIDYFSDTEESVFDLYTGSGLGLDLGIITEIGDWALGASFRDVGGTLLEYSLLEDAKRRDLEVFEIISQGTKITDSEYTIPMTVAIGIGYDPKGFLLPASIFDPVFHGEYQRTFYREDNPEEPGLWTGIHFGMEAKLFNFLKLRGGINQGRGTFGVGAKLWFFDLNASYSLPDRGDYRGLRPKEGFNLEAALRF